MTQLSDSMLDELKSDRLLVGPVVWNEVALTGSLTTKSPLHIGAGTPAGNLQLVALTAPAAGLEGAAIDGSRRPPMSDKRAKQDTAGPSFDPVQDLWPLEGCFPYIPGTTFKGVLRSECLRLLAPFGAGYASVGKRPAGASKPASRPQPSDAEDRPGQQAPSAEAADYASAVQARKEVDLVAGLFGSTRSRSKLEFDDAFVAPGSRGDGRNPRALLHRTPHVAIDPVLGSADDGKLYWTEVVRPGVTFHVRIHATNLRAWELGLVLYALSAMNDVDFPLRLGAGTRQGCGQMAWRLTAASVLGALDAGPDKDAIAATAAARQVCAARLEPGRRTAIPVDAIKRWHDQQVRALAAVLGLEARSDRAGG